MRFTLEIHPSVSQDVIDVFLFINETSSIQADLFVDQVLLEYDKILDELERGVFHQNKRAVKSRSIGKFKNHLIFYQVRNEKRSVEILAVLYAKRDFSKITEMINDRLEGKP